MKFAQLIEYNMTKFFPEKSFTKLVERLFSDPFPKNKKRAYLWINKSL